MNTTMIDTKELILALKKVKDEKQLSLDKILELMKEADPSTAVSKTTLSRIFADGSEDQIFRYENTLRPIANALLDIDTNEPDDDIDTRAMKSLLKLKKDIIDELENKLKTVQSDEKAKYLEKLAIETEKFQQSLDFAKEQIALKDKRIDQLMNDNSKLVNHILDCPYRKECNNES